MSEPLPAALRRERMLELIGQHRLRRASPTSATRSTSPTSPCAATSTPSTRSRASAASTAVRCCGAAGMREPSFEEALESSADEKRRIGHGRGRDGRPRAAACCSTSAPPRRRSPAPSSTATTSTDVTVITNGLTIALELERAIPRFQVVVTGGTLRPLQHSLVEPLASVLLERMHADLAFIGCTGVHPDRRRSPTSTCRRPTSSG